MNIGKLGVWAWTDSMSAPQAAAFARKLESWNYGALWFPEARGRNSFTFAAWLLANTERLVIATGIANMYGRDAIASVGARNGLNEQSDGRFLLGLGVSHAPLVQKMRGHNYDKPLAAMREYLDLMAKAPYDAPAPPAGSELVIAALGPAMLKLAAEKTDGAHPYNVTPEHTARARSILGPDKRLYVEQKVLLESDPAKAREVARKTLRPYMKLPNYRKNWLTLGFSEADLDTSSDKIMDAMVAWGDEAAIRARIQEHWDAGADHVCIQALKPDGSPGPDEKLLEILKP